MMADEVLSVWGSVPVVNKAQVHGLQRNGRWLPLTCSYSSTRVTQLLLWVLAMHCALLEGGGNN